MNPHPIQIILFFSFRSLGLAAWLALMATGAPGAERQSASYVFSDETFDSGGGEASSAAFTAQVSLGQLVIGVSGTEVYAVEHGVSGESAADPPSADYAAWAAAHFTPAQLANPAFSGQGADPDGDGLPNAVEFALRLGPLEWQREPFTARLVSQAGNVTVMFEFIRRGEVPAGATLAVEASASLTGWTALATKAASGAWSGPAMVEESPAPGGGGDVMMVRITVPPASGEEARSRFIRLRVSAP